HVVGDGAGDSVFAVWGYVDVVELPPDWNAFDEPASRSVDHVEPAFPAPDGHQHEPTVLCHRDIVGTPAEPDLVRDLAAGAIHDVQRGLGFIADVDSAAIRGETNAVRRCHTADNLHNLVRRRVYHFDAIAAAVGDVDPYLARGGGEWRQRQEQSERLQAAMLLRTHGASPFQQHIELDHAFRGRPLDKADVRGAVAPNCRPRGGRRPDRSNRASRPKEIALDARRREDIVPAGVQFGPQLWNVVADDRAAPFLDLPRAQNRRYVGALHQRDDRAWSMIERRDVERRCVEQDDVGLFAWGQRAG